MMMATLQYRQKVQKDERNRSVFTPTLSTGSRDGAFRSIRIYRSAWGKNSIHQLEVRLKDIQIVEDAI
jgi:hypothetical protein